MFTTMTMAGSLGLIGWIMRGNALSNATTAAVTWGQDKVEDLRDRRFSQIASGSDTNAPFVRSWTVATSGTGKTRRRELIELPDLLQKQCDARSNLLRRDLSRDSLMSRLGREI